jgi:hypothetical protein
VQMPGGESRPHARVPQPALSAPAAWSTPAPVLQRLKPGGSTQEWARSPITRPCTQFEGSTGDMESDGWP